MTNKEQYKHINLDYIYDMADGENDFVIEIVNNCIDAIGPNMQKLIDAINTNDKTDILFLTHKLKGSFRFIGCNEEGEMIEQIEYLTENNRPEQDIKQLAFGIESRYVVIEDELKQILRNLAI